MSKKVVGLLARQHGLSALQAILASPRFELVAVATHRRLPKREDPNRGDRPEFADFIALTTQHKVPLYSVDTNEEEKLLEQKLLQLDFDLLISVSWRRLIPLPVIQHAKIGGINLHRGRLPEYPGAEPIKQALVHGDGTIVITAHILDEKIDHGDTLCLYEHPVAYQASLSLEVNIERLKTELSPHFGPLILRATDELEKRTRK